MSPTEYLTEVYRVIMADWRPRIVLLAVALTILATSVFYYYVERAIDPTTFVGAAFASWLSGLTLFLFTGVVVTVVTLVRPDQEIFEARARNLLRRQTGLHIEYIVDKLRNALEAYVSESNKKIIILDYDDKAEMFLSSHTTTNVMKSYLDDIAVRFDAKIEYFNGSPQPPGKLACLTHLKVDGVAVGESEEFEEKVYRDFVVSIPRHGECRVEHRFSYWVKASSEANRHTPVRYTKKMTVEIENHLAKHAIVAIIKDASGGDRRIEIPATSSAVVVNLSEREPVETLYEFYIALA